MEDKIDAKVSLKLGMGRVNDDGFEPNICNYKVEVEHDAVYLTDLVTQIDNFQLLYNKLFNAELDYEMIISSGTITESGRRLVLVKFND